MHEDDQGNIAQPDNVGMEVVDQLDAHEVNEESPRINPQGSHMALLGQLSSRAPMDIVREESGMRYEERALRKRKFSEEGGAVSAIMAKDKGVSDASEDDDHIILEMEERWKGSARAQELSSDVIPTSVENYKMGSTSVKKPKGGCDMIDKFPGSKYENSLSLSSHPSLENLNHRSDFCSGDWRLRLDRVSSVPAFALLAKGWVLAATLLPLVSGHDSEAVRDFSVRFWLSGLSGSRGELVSLWCHGRSALFLSCPGCSGFPLIGGDSGSGVLQPLFPVSSLLLGSSLVPRDYGDGPLFRRYLLVLLYYLSVDSREFFLKLRFCYSVLELQRMSLRFGHNRDESVFGFSHIPVPWMNLVHLR
ncbi:hypothetical protein Bca52824_024715 [Brassica carinata]|uniref:Uncharacterized protein n=1 Tax=Brassica carinata TaxID=52824 RepID=A0A8X7VK49_BRACI|nr:hypothetical protein Bca52824_024715 [Brassica carinata]